MDDVLDVGAEPRGRPWRRPRRRTLLLAGGAVVVVGTAALVLTQARATGDTTRIAGTGRSCTVGYGSDLVVGAVEVLNPSPHASATLSGVGLGARTPASTSRAGGPIDIVTATGCEHVLALSGDVVAPGERVWLGLTVRVGTCQAVTVPVVVGYDGGDGARDLTVDVRLPAGETPACAPAVGAARGG